MLPLMRKWLIVGMLVLAISSPWALLQSVAWFGMLVNYSRKAGLPQAVAMTFDGQHPCPLCHLVKEGQAEERQREKQKAASDQKLQLSLPPARFVMVHAPAQRCLIRVERPPATRTDPPPSPPPRSA